MLARFVVSRRRAWWWITIMRQGKRVAFCAGDAMFWHRIQKFLNRYCNMLNHSANDKNN
jgi:hypothetical protein